MTAKHTPGPWAVGSNINGPHWERIEVHAREGHVCVAARLGDGPEAEANARLIAAAPELLDAHIRVKSFCVELRESLHSEAATPREFEEQLRVVRGIVMTLHAISDAAIANAAGGSK